jgi:hypothetical protein
MSLIGDIPVSDDAGAGQDSEGDIVAFREPDPAR